MKNPNLLTLFLFLPLLAFAGQPESEIIDQVSYRKVIGNKLICSDTITLQINMRAGDDDAEISIPYTKKDKLTMGDAWIEDVFGNVIRKMKKNEIKDVSAISDFSLYEDDFVKTFQLKHNVYPYRIVYSYQIVTSDFLSIFSWNPSYGNPCPVRNFKFTAEVPSDYAVRYKQQLVDEPMIEKNETITKYIWTGSYTPVKKETEADEDKYRPEITLLPISFKYGEKGSFTDWVSFGDWLVELNKNTDVLPLEEQQKIDRMLTGVTDKKEKARILYRYLQEYTRYINVKINLGGLRSYPVSYVCANKYGDCKALCNYMKSMLIYAGIPAYYTLIDAGDDLPSVDKDFPEQAFNHIIVTVPLESDTVFLECTNKNIPFGYLGTFTQGRDALMIIPGESRFVRTPALTPQNVLCERIIKLSEYDNAEIEMICRGDEYERMTYLYHQVDKNRVDRFVRSHLLSGIASGVQSWDLTKQSEDLPEIAFKASIQIQNRIKKYGNNLILPAFPFDLPNFETPDKRTEDVLLNYPVACRDTLIYNLAGYSFPEQIPENSALKSEYGKYIVSYHREGDNLKIIKELEINSGKYPIEKYPGFYDFISSVKNSEKKGLYLDLN